jgi:MFS family permease
MLFLTATLGAFSAGTVLGWSSPSQSRLVDDQEYGFSITTAQYSWIGSIITLGAAAVSIPIGSVMNYLGRKKTMILTVLPFTLGWALIAWAQNFTMLLIGRALVGMCAGCFCILSPIYIGEIAEKEIRGELGSYFQLMITLGILFVYAVGSVISVSWTSIICGIVPLVFGVIFMFMPETPTYFVSGLQICFSNSFKSFLHSCVCRLEKIFLKMQ